MIHAAIFKTTDPAARASLIVSGSREAIALNTPPGGCWRPVPVGCAGAADLPALGEMPQPSTAAAPREARAKPAESEIQPVN